MPDNLDELIEGEGFTDEERKEIREPAPASAGDPAPPEPEPDAPPEPEAPPEEPELPLVAEEKSPKPDFIQRLDQEKAKRKAAEKELADLRAKWEQTEKRIAEMSAPKPETPIAPDPNVDPWGYVVNRIGTTEENLKLIMAEVEKRKQQEEEARNRDAFSRKWNAELQEFQRTEKPDVIDSMNFLKDVRVRQLTALGLQPAQIEEALANEEQGIVATAYAAGRHPADLFYEIASITGYRPKEAQKNGDDGAEDLKRIAAGQKKAASSVASGAADISGLTLEKILDMPAAEYEDLVLKKFGGSYEKLLSKLQQ